MLKTRPIYDCFFALCFSPVVKRRRKPRASALEVVDFGVSAFVVNIHDIFLRFIIECDNYKKGGKPRGV